MEELLKSIKESLAFLWKHAKTPEEKVIKKYDIWILVCIVFMVIYSTVFILSLQKKDAEPTGVFSVNDDPDYSIKLFLSTNLVIPGPSNHSVYKKELPKDEYFVGEIVGIKYFNIYGVIIEKTLGTEGYKYTVRWKNTEKDLPTGEFHRWEIYRVQADTIPISALQN